MARKRIFYSIDIDCTDQDIMNFIRLNHPEGKFNYEYVEDVKEERPDYFKELVELVNPNK